MNIYDVAAGYRTFRFFVFLTLLFLLMPVVAHAQFNIITNNNTITIIGYDGLDGDVTIPDTVDGLPVSDIGQLAFETSSVLTKVTIGNNVTNIGGTAFLSCSNLSDVIIPGNVSDIGIGAFLGCSSLTNLDLGVGIKFIDDFAFSFCSSLTSVIIPDSVTNTGWGIFQNCDNLVDVTLPDSLTGIHDSTFDSCTNLTRVIIPASVTNLGYLAFGFNPNLKEVFFRGDAPSPESTTFLNSINATAYYLPGAANWDVTFAGIPTAIWLPFIRGEVSIAEPSNHFGFFIDWAKGMELVIDVSTDLNEQQWSGIATNLLSGDLSRYEDALWSNHMMRTYRLRW